VSLALAEDLPELAPVTRNPVGVLVTVMFCISAGDSVCFGHLALCDNERH